MDWLIDKGEHAMNLWIDGKIYHSLDLMTGTYECCFSAAKPNSYCCVSYLDPPVSCLWNVTLKVTFTLKPIGNKPLLSKSFVCDLCYTNTLQTFYLWPSKDVKDYSDDNRSPVLQISLEVIESRGLHCSIGENAMERLKKSLDGILLVEDKQISVNKASLSVDSSFFDALFNSEFIERKNGIFKLQDVKYDEIVCLMRIIYGFQHINIKNYEFLLELSDRFELLKVKPLCESFIVEDKNSYFTSTSYDLALSLKLADQYGLTRVQGIVIACIESLDDLKELSDSCDFKKTSSASQAFVMKCCLDKIADDVDD